MNRDKAKKLLKDLHNANKGSDLMAVILNWSVCTSVRQTMNLLKNYECGNLEKFVEGHDFKYEGVVVDPEYLNFHNPPKEYQMQPLKHINWEKVMKHGGYGLEFEFRDNEGCEWERGKLHGFDPDDDRAWFANMSHDSDWYRECRLITDVAYPDQEWYDQ